MGCRQRETVEDGGSLLLRVCRASTDEQETLPVGATGSSRKSTEAWQYAPQPTTDLGARSEALDTVAILQPGGGIGEYGKVLKLLL